MALSARAMAALGVAVAVCSLGARPVLAGDTVAADALFKEALTLMDQGKWDEACPKFRASFDLDPSVSTLINVSRCSEREGKLATAWGQLAEAGRLNQATAASPRRTQFEALIKKQSDALDARVPRARIVIEGTGSAPITVLRDGTAVPASALSLPLPVDPGEHVITANAEGYEPQEKRFSIKEGETVDVRIMLTKAAATKTDPIGPKRPDGKEPPPDPRGAVETGPSGQAIAGYALMGAGGAGLIVGGVLAGLAGGKAGKIPATCSQDPFVCPTEDETATANDASKSGQSFLTGSIVGFSAGAALLATGVIVFATDSSSDSGAKASVTARISPLLSPGALGVRGSLRW